MLHNFAVRLPNTAAMSTPIAMKRDFNRSRTPPVAAPMGELVPTEDEPVRVWNGVAEPIDVTDFGTELPGLILRALKKTKSATPATTITTSAAMIA